MANNVYPRYGYFRLVGIEHQPVFALNPEPAVVGCDGRPIYEAVPVSFLEPGHHVEVLGTNTYPPQQGVAEPHYHPVPDHRPPAHSFHPHDGVILPVADHLYPSYQRHHRDFDSANARQGVIPIEEYGAFSGAGFHHVGFYDAYGRPIFIASDPAQLAEQAAEEEEAEATTHTRVELYVPLCCDKCVKYVKRSLGAVSGVEHVYADQSDKNVVVTGSNLCPDTLLRHLHIPHKPKNSSALWADRPSS